MAADIRCHDGQGDGCGKLLGRVDGANVVIVCPRCGKAKLVPIILLIQELQAYLCEVEAAAQESGKGFML